MKYYIIAGEKSGDLHASNLIKALKKKDPNASFRVWGGDMMEEAGAEIVTHYREMAFMGFLEVIKNLPRILGFIKKCKADILKTQPDVVILVDYAGFNMRIAKFAKKKGFRTFYYISPKIWAWNQGRAKNIKKYIDRMFVILPFEKEFYKKYDYAVDYVGNPLFDAITNFEKQADFHQKNQLNPTQKIIALLPGSRKQEVNKILPVLLGTSKQFTEYQFVIAGVNNLDETLYQEAKQQNFHVIFNQTYDLLQHAHAAIVTSGTATLETALFEVPQVVAYKTSPITAFLVRQLIKIDYVSLVNLIAGKEVVKELLQSNCTTETLTRELTNVLHQNREQMIQDYKDIKKQIQTEGVSKRTADLMWKYLN
jgi:lipid-A-disaccharide synthase